MAIISTVPYSPFQSNVFDEITPVFQVDSGIATNEIVSPQDSVEAMVNSANTHPTVGVGSQPGATYPGATINGNVLTINSSQVVGSNQNTPDTVWFATIVVAGNSLNSNTTTMTGGGLIWTMLAYDLDATNSIRVEIWCSSRGSIDTSKSIIYTALFGYALFNWRWWGIRNISPQSSFVVNNSFIIGAPVQITLSSIKSGSLIMGVLATRNGLNPDPLSNTSYMDLNLYVAGNEMLVTFYSDYTGPTTDVTVGSTTVDNIGALIQTVAVSGLESEAVVPDDNYNSTLNNRSISLTESVTTGVALSGVVLMMPRESVTASDSYGVSYSLGAQLLESATPGTKRVSLNSGSVVGTTALAASTVSATPANGSGGASDVWVALITATSFSSIQLVSTLTGGGLTWTKRNQVIDASNVIVNSIWTAVGIANGTAVTVTLAGINAGIILRLASFTVSDPTQFQYISATGNGTGTEQVTITVSDGSMLYGIGATWTSNSWTSANSLANTFLLDSVPSNSDSDDMHSFYAGTSGGPVAQATGPVTFGSSKVATTRWLLTGVEIKESPQNVTVQKIIGVVASEVVVPDDSVGSSIKSANAVTEGITPVESDDASLISGGSGGTVTGDVLEQVIVSDSVYCNLLQSNGESESISPSDQISALGVFTASESESITASDQISCTTTLSVSSTESITSSDLYSQTTKLGGLVSENCNADTLEAAQSYINASSLEYALSSDQILGGVGSSLSYSDTVIATETTAGVSGMVLSAGGLETASADAGLYNYSSVNSSLSESGIPGVGQDSATVTAVSASSTLTVKRFGSRSLSTKTKINGRLKKK